VNPLVILVPVLVVLAIVVVVASARRRDSGDAIGSLARETVRSDRGEPSVLGQTDAPSAGKEVEMAAVAARTGSSEVATRDSVADLAPFVPPDPEQVGVSRRQFFNRGIIAFFILGLSGFGAAVLGMLWPRPTEGFGAAIKVGTLAEVKDQIAANNGFLYFAEGRMWLTEYPAGAIKNAQSSYPPAQLTGMEAGVIALWQTCPHLGCRVPECVSSQWFECPCHGSQYNQVGEKQGGPAPRGMDGFAMDVTGGQLTVDTGTIIEGRPIGVDTIGQEPQGPHCVTGGAH